MRLRRISHLFILILFILYPTGMVLSAPENEPESPDAWSAVAPGIEYQKYHLTTPTYKRDINIFVARMDRSNLGVAIESSIAQGRLSGGTETIGGMAARYDQAINYWGETWGNRNRVVVAINGYFFGYPEELPGVPWSGQIHSGWYAKRYSETVGDAGFVWKLNREAYIGKCVYHRSERNDVYFVGAAYDPNINAINVVRTDEQLILYTPQYDATTKTLENGATPRVEILIELTRPGLLVSDPSNVRGYIREIRRNNGSTPIPFDHVVLAAWGDVGSAMVNRINSDDIVVGNEVRITQEITDCPSETVQHDWSKAYAGIGGDYHFLKDGGYYAPNNPDATWPNSRTVIAYNASYVYYIVVDAFDPGVSLGITIPELSYFLTRTLGATDAVSLDSGTSSTMVINGKVVNNTYCNYTRNCGTQGTTGITPLGTNAPSSGSAIQWSSAESQAYVGNGMMMVVVEPKSSSSSFVEGQIVSANQQTSIRLGPGTNYPALATMFTAEQGQVERHSVNGVLAKGSYWWKVAVGGSVGWVKEEALIGGQIPKSPADVELYLPIIER